MPQFADITTPSFAGLAPPSFSGIEPDRGIVGTLLHEMGLDLLGGARVVGATGGELLGLLGANVPLTYEDLTTRDVRGAMMLGALGVGGVAGGAVRGALGVANTALGRAGATALSEAVAGAAFGLVSPLEEDQSRLGSIVGNAALGGAVGAGASMMKSAVKATLSARTAAVKAAATRVSMQEVLRSEQSEMLAREMAGIQLLNKETGERIGVRRSPDGSSVLTTIYNPGADKRRLSQYSLGPKGSVAAVTVQSPAKDFDTAIAEAVRNGFTDELGPWNPNAALGHLSGHMDQNTLDLIAGHSGDITRAVGLAEMGKYSAIRQAAALSEETHRELGSLFGEVVAQSDWLGAPTLGDSLKLDLGKELGMNAATIAKSADTDILREAIRQGIVDVDNLATGMSHDDFIRELVLNDRIGAANIMVSRRRDAFLTSILLPQRIAKWHPEVEPLVSAADSALRAIDFVWRPKAQWLHELKTRIGVDAARRGVDIIDRSLRVVVDEISGLPKLDVQATRAFAEAQAAALGDPATLDFVTSVMPELERYHATLAPMVADNEFAQASLLPMFNANKWNVQITGGVGGDVKWTSAWNTRGEALAEAERVRRIAPSATGIIAPQQFTMVRESLLASDAALERGKLHRSLIDANTSRFGPAEQISVPSKAVSLNDFSDDPFEALGSYMFSAERMVALRPFEELATPLIEALPSSQSNLRAWAEQYRDDLLGRPRASERWLDNLLEGMGIDAKPRALRRYTSAIRRWETVSRLGGFWSSAVNLTQVMTNGFAVLGPRYLARGMGALVHPRKAAAELASAGVDIGMHIPFTEASAGAIGHPGYDTIRAALKERRFIEAMERIALFTFNGTEKMNRLVTAWGAYQRGMDEKIGSAAAGRAAQTVLDRTQFNYRASNMPELLRGPLGGVALQFKSFLINEIDFIASLSPAEAARFGGALSTLGGAAVLFNMPGGDLVDLASLGWSQEKLSEALAIETGQHPGEPMEAAAWRAVAFGLPGIAHVNLSDHIGLGTMREITSGILGPGPRDMLAFAKYVKDGALDIASAGQVSDDTRRAFLTATMPSAMRRLRRGMEIAETGEVRAIYTGKLLYKPEARLYEASLTALGAPTVQQSEQLAANAAVERIRLGYTRARTSFGKRIGMSIIEGDQQGFQHAIAEAREAGHIFTGQDVSQWAKEMRKPAATRRRERLPRAMRADLQELYRMTGTTTPDL